MTLAHFRAGSEWKACCTVAVCHGGDKDEVMEDGTPEGLTGKKTGCCYSRGSPTHEFTSQSED